MAATASVAGPLSERLAGALAGRVRRLVGSGELDLARPPGDPGLFAVGSPAWRVHGDFSAMMIGGIAALLLQMLHPLALAGVWDFSDFRRDRLGRLRRTAQFIAATTYGSTATAIAAIEQVRRIHDRVHGALPDGTPYDANDPALLTWVHVAEAHCFLAAHLAYREPGMSAADQDRYIDESAEVAIRLGAADVPRSRAAVRRYFDQVRPDLRYDHRTRDVADALLARGDDPASSAALSVASAAAFTLLPPWAAAMHGRAASPLLQPAIRAGAGSLGALLRWSLKTTR